VSWRSFLASSLSSRPPSSSSSAASKTYELTVEWERTGGKSGIPFVWFGNQKRIPYDALMRWVDGQLGPSAA